YFDPAQKVDPAKVVRVKGGEIELQGRVKGYLRTKQQFGDFVLRLQWRWDKNRVDGVRDSGVFVFVSGPDKIWPKGVKTQLQVNQAGDLWLVDNFKLHVDPARRDKQVPRRFHHTKKDVEKPIGEWNQYEVTCKGDTIKLVVNGQEVNAGT